MAIRVVQLGTPRSKSEGLRIGTVRRPPRGVRKENFAKLNYYDVWMPELAPSAELVSWIKSEPITPKRWAHFKKKYLSEMRDPAAQHVIAMLAALSSETNFSIGCYCDDESCCHRSILRDLLRKQGGKIART
jgi:uncharacterized protein YeaO (DUF488 family)